MSRTLLLLAAGLLVLAGLAPVGAMALRVEAADWAGLFEPRVQELLLRTFGLGLGSASLALALGLPFGWLTARTDVPGASLLRPLGMVPLLLPPIVLAMTWVMIVDLRGMTMTILLLGIGTAPLVALFAGRAAERIDARREEAALLVGGGRAVLAMELPLVLPPALCGACLAFVFAINDYALPDFVSSVGRKFSVYADEVFASWRLWKAPGRAVVTAVPLVLLSLLALVPALSLRRRGAMATVDSRFRAPRPLALGPWRWPALVFCLVFVALGALVPVGRLLFEAGGGHLPAGWSGETLRAAFARALELSRDNIASTLGYTTAAATLAVPAALVLGHAVQRTRAGWGLEALSILPLAVPGVLLGIGTIALWSRPLTADFYAGGGLVVLLLVGRYLAFPVLVSSGAVASLDPRLEDAARLAGAGPVRRLCAIVAPSLLPSLLGAWVLVFVLSVRELDAAILVPAANDMVMYRVFNQVHFGRSDFVAALALVVVFLILLPGLLWSLFARRRMELLP